MVPARVPFGAPLARTSFVRPALLATSVLLVFVFLVSHPYLEGAGLCDDGGCPPATQLSHATHAESSGCPAAVLAAAGAAAPALFAFVGCRRAARERRPLEAYLPPEPPPPRFFRDFLSS